MKQLFSSTLVAVMVIACCYGSVSALEAPDMRASLTLSSYNVGLTAGDSAGMISISYDVQSNKLASSIGVETVDIYKADGSYVTSITGSTSNGLIETNSDICKSYNASFFNVQLYVVDSIIPKHIYAIDNSKKSVLCSLIYRKKLIIVH